MSFDRALSRGSALTSYAVTAIDVANTASGDQTATRTRSTERAESRSLLAFSWPAPLRLPASRNPSSPVSRSGRRLLAVMPLPWAWRDAVLLPQDQPVRRDRQRPPAPRVDPLTGWNRHCRLVRGRSGSSRARGSLLRPDRRPYGLDAHFRSPLAGSNRRAGPAARHRRIGLRPPQRPRTLRLRPRPLGMPQRVGALESRPGAARC